MHSNYQGLFEMKLFEWVRLYKRERQKTAVLTWRLREAEDLIKICIDEHYIRASLRNELGNLKLSKIAMLAEVLVRDALSSWEKKQSRRGVDSSRGEKEGYQ